jgi:hypothetical protein
MAYGTTGLDVEVPPEAHVVWPHAVPALPDPAGALQAALRRPLAGPARRACVGAGRRVAIAVCDVTRPQPRRCHLEPVADASAAVREALARAGASARGCVLPVGPRAIAYAP